MRPLPIFRGPAICLLVFWALATGTSISFAQTTLKYKFNLGAIQQYAVEMTNTQKLTTNGKVEVGTTTLKLNVMQWVKAVGPNGTAQISLRINTLNFRHQSVGVQLAYDSENKKDPVGPGDQQLGLLANAIVGQNFELTLSADGDVNGVQLPATLEAALKQVTAENATLAKLLSKEAAQQIALSTFFPHLIPLPHKEVVSEETWDYKSGQQLGAVTGNYSAALKYKGSVHKAGKPLEKIEAVAKNQFSTTPGSAFTAKTKASTLTGTILFDGEAGLVVEFGSTSTTTTEMAIKGQKGTVESSKKLTSELQIRSR